MSDSSEKVVLTENDNVSQQKEIRLVDVVVSDENVALNLMVSFLSLAHKRRLI